MPPPLPFRWTSVGTGLYYEVEYTSGTHTYYRATRSMDRTEWSTHVTRGQRHAWRVRARNLTGENYEEFQELNDSRIDTNSYALGRSFSLGIKFRF